MGDLLGFLRDAVGIRPLVPIVVAVALGLLFINVRGYPTRELIYDRWYLLSLLVVTSATIGYYIWSSGLADRTPEGRYGIYVASFTNDPDKSVQLRFVETLKAQFGLKESDSKLRIDVRDLKRPLSDDDLQDIDSLATALNAGVVVWGVVVEENTIRPRYWTKNSGVQRYSNELVVSDMPALAEYAEIVWGELLRVADRQKQETDPSQIENVAQQLKALQAEVFDLRSAMSAMRLNPAAVPVASPLAISAILVGVGDYQGQADLKGPPNDVKSLKAALLERSSNANVQVLLNTKATAKKIIELVNETADSLPTDQPLILYFSGHTASDENTRVTSFYLSNLKDQVDLSLLAARVCQKHAKTVMIVDGGFDPKGLSSELPPGCAILAADDRGLAVELSINGKFMGAFTAALVRALKSAPTGIGLPTVELFAMTQAELVNANAPKPVLVAGKDPPVL